MVGDGDVRVTVAVPLTWRPHVKVGQRATVTPDGSTRPVAGSVVSIGLLPVTGTTTYPVVVSVPAGPGLSSGSSAAVSIVLAMVADVATLPNSAMTTATTASTATVRVLSKGAVTRKTVKVGVVGAFQTQVVSGLAPGDEVVLADRTAALPASSSTTPRIAGAGGFGGAGGFARNGTGGAAGGFPGGAPPG